MSTTNLPGRDTSWVRRAPLAPIGFLVTWQMIVCLARSICSIRRFWFLPLGAPSTSSASKCTSPRYSTAFFGVPMSTNAASMPGRTFCTRPR